MPELEHGQHLLTWLNEIGITGQGYNGPIPLSWQELKAWRDCTGTAATSEEMLMLRQLSVDYIAQYNSSADPNAPPPNAPRNSDKEAVAKSLKAGLRRAAENRKK